MPGLTHDPRALRVRSLLDVAPLPSTPNIPTGITGSDGLVIDLRDMSGVPDIHVAVARLTEAWREAGGGTVLARIRPLSVGDDISTDIAIAVSAKVDGLLLPGITAGADLQHLHSLIGVEEALSGMEQETLSIVAELGDQPLGVLQAASLAGKTPRLAGIVYDPEALATATGMREIGGSATVTGRGLVLMAAAAAGVPAFEALPRSIERNQLSVICSRLLNDGLHGAMTRDAGFLERLRSSFAGAG